ncbi:head-tail adaptor protein [Micromonospora sp. NPDC001898]|uniref:phage head completion protein n=1 Tax=Micromonospora sp. NPDC001898 TaxID=3364221 RepID=UPI0036BBBF7B
MRLSDRVTRVRAALVDVGYGNKARDWDNAPPGEVYRAEVQPLPTSEDIVGEQRVTTRFRVFLPPTADLEATDHVVWDGATYEVDGAVLPWKRRGVLHHLEALLIRVEQGEA